MSPAPRSNSTTEIVPAIDVMELLRPLRRRWWLVGLFLVVGVGAGFAYLATTDHLYRAVAVLEVAPQKKGLLKSEEHIAGESRKLESMNTLAESITSPELMHRIAERHLMGGDSFFSGGSVEEVAEKLAGALSTGLRRGTHLIDLAVYHPERERALTLSKVLIGEFADLNEEQYRQDLAKEREDLESQASEQKQQVEEAERELQQAKKAAGIAIIEQDGKSEESRLQAIQSQLQTARNHRIGLESKAGLLLESLERDGRIAPSLAATIPGIGTRQEIVGLQRGVAEKEAALRAMSRRYGPRHPSYEQAEIALEAGRNRLDELLIAAGQTVITEFEVAKAAEQQMVEELERERQASIGRREAVIPILKLQRKVESLRTAHTQILGQLSEAIIAAELTRELVEVRSAPTVSTSPVKPVKKLVLAATAFLGLVSGCGLALVLELFSRTYASGGEVEEDLGIPTLGGIPWDRTSGLRSGSGFPDLDPSGKGARAFRSIRNSVTMASRYGIDAKTILVTSPHSGDGKSCCAVNLATTFARHGERTLVVEANFHTPVLRDLLGSRASPNGLNELLGETAELSDCLAAEIAPGLSAMHSGKIVASSPDFFGQQSMIGLLTQAGEFFDRVIVDTPSLDASGDALAFLDAIQAAILVVKQGATPRDDVRRALTRLRLVGPQMFIGTAVNHSSLSPLRASSRQFQEATGLILPALIALEDDGTAGARRLLPIGCQRPGPSSTEPPRPEATVDDPAGDTLIS